MRTLAILPVKRFGLAKQRLAERLSPEQREALAQAMVTDVLSALVISRRLDGVLVITNEPSVVAIAEGLGATIAPDRRDAGQSAAAAIGVEHAKRNGFERVLMVPGDCPALARDEQAPTPCCWRHRTRSPQPSDRRASSDTANSPTRPGFAATSRDHRRC